MEINIGDRYEDWQSGQWRFYHAEITLNTGQPSGFQQSDKYYYLEFPVLQVEDFSKDKETALISVTGRDCQRYPASSIDVIDIIRYLEKGILTKLEPWECHAAHVAKGTLTKLQPPTEEAAINVENSDDEHAGMIYNGYNDTWSWGI